MPNSQLFNHILQTCLTGVKKGKSVSGAKLQKNQC